MSDKSGHAAEARPADAKREAGPEHRQDQKPRQGIDDVIDFDNVETIQSARALLSIALLTSRIHELHHRLDEIDLAVQRVRTALVALSTIRGIVDDAKMILRTGAAFSDVTGYPALAATFNEFCNHMDLLVEESTLDDINLLKGIDYTVRFSEDGSGQLTVRGADLTADGLGISRLSEAAAGESDFVIKVKELTFAAQNLGAQATLLEGALTVINSRRTFTRKLVKTLDQAARQITEDKTGRSSFYQTVSGLLGASARHQLATAIARFDPDKENSTTRTSLADSIPVPRQDEDDAVLSEDVSEAESSGDTSTDAAPEADTAPAASDVQARQQALADRPDGETPHISQLAGVPEAQTVAESTEFVTEDATPAELSVGPVDLALASLNQTSVVHGEEKSLPNDNEDVAATRNEEIKNAPKDEGAPEETNSPASGTWEKKTGSIRMILNRLRRNEQEKDSADGSSKAQVGGVPGPAQDDLTIGSDLTGAQSDLASHDEQVEREEQIERADERISVQEYSAREPVSAALDHLSAGMLKALDLNAYVEARASSEAGDRMIYARRLGELVSERGDHIHKIFVSDEAFRTDVRQFKLSFLRLIKADIEDDEQSKPDTSIGKWLQSVYGVVYKCLYRNCPSDDRN